MQHTNSNVGCLAGTNSSIASPNGSNRTARATARRNVADRIDRFLNGLERTRRQPNRRELFWLREALANLQGLSSDLTICEPMQAFR